MSFAWEKAAANGAPMPANLPLAEQKAYQAIAHLYGRFKTGAINQAQAIREKHQIEMQLKRETAEAIFNDNLAYHQARTIRLTESAKTLYRKEPTAEHGRKLLEVLDGIDRDDPVMQAVRTRSGAACPVCEYPFSESHADAKPNFCERCGCRLGWQKRGEHM